MTGAEDLLIEGGTAAILILMIIDLRRKVLSLCRQVRILRVRIHRLEKKRGTPPI